MNSHVFFYWCQSKKILATPDPKLRKIIAGGGEGNAEIGRFLPQIPQSLIEYYAKHQPEYVELEYLLDNLFLVNLIFRHQQ